MRISIEREVITVTPKKIMNLQSKTYTINHVLIVDNLMWSDDWVHHMPLNINDSFYTQIDSAENWLRSINIANGNAIYLFIYLYILSKIKLKNPMWLSRNNENSQIRVNI